MKAAAAFFALLAGCSCLVQPAAITVAAPEAPSLIDYITDATVVLAHDHRLVCAGVWIGPTTILTAAHCTDPEDGPTTFSVRGEFKDGTEDMLEKDHPTILLARDEAMDLALLETFVTVPHEIAQMSIVRPTPGLHVNIMGHTGGLAYSYSPGWISAVRHGVQGPDPIRGDFLQVWAGSWGGNSGGGVFDDDGYLMGICSFRTNGAPLTFFVAGTTVAAFLEAHGV